MILCPGRKYLIVIFTVLVLFQNASGQDRKGLLWEISGNNLPRPSYLFGTIHLLCPDQINISDSVIHAITATNQMVLEIDFSDPSNPGRISNGMKVNKSSQKMRHYLSRDDYNFLKDFFADSLNLSLNSISNVNPLFLMTLIIPRAMKCQAVSLESKLTDLAAMYHRNIVGLETIEEQIAYINKIGPKEQTAMLLRSVKNYTDTKMAYHEMVRLYKNHAIDQLFNYIEKQNSGYLKLTQTLVFNRNKLWAEKIRNIISTKSSFIAVGAGHLGGNNGLISLLESSGYVLTPVE